jgi:hypothetical protein
MPEGRTIKDRDHWISRARHLRRVALTLKRADARANMLRIVHDYEKMAAHVDSADRRRD